MQFNQLKRRHKNKRSVQVGRGGTRGRTSGRGGKGQTARAGHKIRPEMRDVIKRLPKLRGRGENIFKSFRDKPSVVNLKLIEKNFASGDTVNPETLSAKGLLKISAGRKPRVKILSSGDLTKKLNFAGCMASAGAKEKIEKAGGAII